MTVIVLHMRGPWRARWWLLRTWRSRRRDRQRAHRELLALADPENFRFRVEAIRQALEERP